MECQRREELGLTVDEFNFISQFVEVIIQNAQNTCKTSSGSCLKCNGVILEDGLSADSMKTGKKFARHTSSVMNLRAKIRCLGAAICLMKSMQKASLRPVKFLFYDRGVPVFASPTGALVTARRTRYSHERIVPGSASEMALLKMHRFKSKRKQLTIQIPGKERTPETTRNIRKTMNGVKYDSASDPHTAHIGREVLNVWTGTGRTPRQKNEQLSIVKGFRFKKKKQYNIPEAVADGFVLIEEDNRKRVMIPAFATVATPLTQKQGPGSEKKTTDESKVSKRRHVPRPAPETQFQILAQRATTKKRRQENQMYAFDFSQLSGPNRGVKQTRPVRGFRTCLSKPHKKIQQVSRASIIPTSNMGAMVSSSAYPQNGSSEKVKDKSLTTPTMLSYHEPFQMLPGDIREECLTSAMAGANRTTPESRQGRESVTVPTVSVPKKGRIKLTALPYELCDPEYFDDRRQVPPPPRHHVLRKSKFKVILPVCRILLLVPAGGGEERIAVSIP